jgi:putative tryptophan/tyrosine transport system substrate-binding protein
MRVATSSSTRRLGIAAAWPCATQSQQQAIPVIGFVYVGSAEASAGYVAAFRNRLGETGYVEHQNVTVEHHFLDGQYDRLAGLMADLVRRRVAVIVVPANTPQPKLQPKRSRLSLVPLKTPSNLVL